MNNHDLVHLHTCRDSTTMMIVACLQLRMQCRSAMECTPSSCTTTSRAWGDIWMDASVTTSSVTFLHDKGKLFEIPGEERWCLYSVYVGSQKQTMTKWLPVMSVMSGTTRTAWRFHSKRGQTQSLTGLALAVLFSYPVYIVLYCFIVLLSLILLTLGACARGLQ